MLDDFERSKLSVHAARHIAELEVVTACPIDHYLGCYDGNKDALALHAEQLVPNWQKRMNEWKP